MITKTSNIIQYIVYFPLIVLYNPRAATFSYSN